MPATHLSMDDSNSEFKKPINRMHACVLSHFSHVRFCAMLWTASRQAPLSMKFSRQEYGNGLLCTPRGSSQFRDQTHVFNVYLHWQVDSLPLVPARKPNTNKHIGYFLNPFR